MKIKIKDGVLQINHEGGVTLNGVKIIGENNTLETWPIDSVYISMDEVSPASKFGGTWEQIKGKFLVGLDETNENLNWIRKTVDDKEVFNEGGEEYHTLTIDEMPSHTHDITSRPNPGYHGVTNYNGTSDWGGIAAAGNASPNALFYLTNTGGSQPHNNMPPYLVVSIWKRVA